MKGANEYFELESVEFQDQYLVDGRLRKNPWQHDLLRSVVKNRRHAAIALACAMGALILIISTRSGSGELPSEGYGLSQLDLEQNSNDLLQTATVTPFRTNITCGGMQDCCSYPGGLQLDQIPYSYPLDRSVCEDNIEDYDWREDLRYSEILLCYNLTSRMCVKGGDDWPEEYNWAEDFHWASSSSCAYQFFEHEGSLNMKSGVRMPESFRSQCSDKLEWNLWYSTSPETGCDEDLPLRFCDCEGKVNLDMIENGTGPFNCREFEIIDLYQMGSEDESGLERDCKREAEKCL